MNFPEITRRPARHTRPAVVVALLTAAGALLTGGCDSGSAASDDEKTGRLPTRAQVSDALLRATDLTGYTRVKPDPKATPPDRSDSPRCLRTLNDLDAGTPARGTAVQARIQFSQSQSGPWLRETLRVYRSDDDAKGAYRKAVSALSDCARFTVTWSKDGNTGTESVQETAAPRLGDRSWAAAIRFEGVAFRTGETKTLIQSGRQLIVISHAATPDAPAYERTQEIARRATERASRNPKA
ncbi:hypothetical protein [Streptomyces avermitilis]|uniref:hypothetical protein n=1 Tax=Streptomyces avermitilis TaxID=33903 RepID=UPI0038012C31